MEGAKPGRSRRQTLPAADAIDVVRHQAPDVVCEAHDVRKKRNPIGDEIAAMKL